MSDHLFWRSEEQFGRLEPHLPDEVRGVPRVDDRRVVSGIVNVLKSGCRWVDAPSKYGPRKTLCNRFVRFTRTLWQSQCRRASIRQAQGLPSHRDAIRPQGRRLSLRRLPCRCSQRLLMRPKPKSFLVPRRWRDCRRSSSPERRPDLRRPGHRPGRGSPAVSAALWRGRV